MTTKGNNFRSDEFFKEKRSNPKQSIPLNLQVLHQVKKERKERSKSARKENKSPELVMETPEKVAIVKS